MLEKIAATMASDFVQNVAQGPEESLYLRQHSLYKKTFGKD